MKEELTDIYTKLRSLVQDETLTIDEVDALESAMENIMVVIRNL